MQLINVRQPTLLLMAGSLLCAVCTHMLPSSDLPAVRQSVGHETWRWCTKRTKFTNPTMLHLEQTCGHNLQYKISQNATGWLLFMRCVSFTFIRLLPTWTPTEIFDLFWAKLFSDCDFIICPIKSKLRFLKVCKILKRTWHFQTDWILCVVNCSGCNHVVNDAGSTCSCC